MVLSRSFFVLSVDFQRTRVQQRIIRRYRDVCIAVPASHSTLETTTGPVLPQGPPVILDVRF
jgi:hypothetical protein